MTTEATIANESGGGPHSRMVKVTRTQYGHDTVTLLAPGQSCKEFVYPGQSLLIEEGEEQ